MMQEMISQMFSHSDVPLTLTTVAMVGLTWRALREGGKARVDKVVQTLADEIHHRHGDHHDPRSS